MAVEVKEFLPITQRHEDLGLSDELVLQMYYHLLLSRRLDERCWILQRQGRVPFHISGIAHEGIGVGAAYALRRGFDIVHPYYRDLALSIALGMRPIEFMLALFGKKGDPHSAARQLPSHFSLRHLNIISGSSPVATQVPQAAGIALAEVLKQKLRPFLEAAGFPVSQEMRVVLTTTGEGSTSEGDFHEALNWAGIYRLPLVVLVHNNQYAISVPVWKQMAVPRVADRAAAYGVHGIVCDGSNVLEVYRVVREAVDRARAGEGTTLVEAVTYRWTPHSSDDDDRTYRTREEVERGKRHDPLPRFRDYLYRRSLLTQRLEEELEEQVQAEVDEAQRLAEEMPYPDPEEALASVFATEDRSGWWGQS
ncbi:MAG: thiamine pyrophosphate-dependent dehydrogenase E1 component subunit alpha [Anaerolineae bacterium]|nr:thiamine pyrophosphate-dependent dehydrogenase E1 component subunit alpha [Thermoflexus sp.]MDW8065052.1 thiamine pyrophosphate-dependent dehydrogenase E1 component subunit alpha [Anaerolineae bacterium]